MYTIEPNRWRALDGSRLAPNFQLRSATTGHIIFSELITKPHLVLAFLPGVWAPWCRKFLNEIEIMHTVMKEVGIYCLVIVSQEFNQLHEYVCEADLSVEVLADPNGVISKRYGVFDDNATEPMKISKPSIFTADREKRLLHSFIGRHLSDRPLVSEILSKATEPQPAAVAPSRQALDFRRLAYVTN